jgi:hypothetical protein
MSKLLPMLIIKPKAVIHKLFGPAVAHSATHARRQRIWKYGNGNGYHTNTQQKRDKYDSPQRKPDFTLYPPNRQHDLNNWRNKKKAHTGQTSPW